MVTETGAPLSEPPLEAACTAPSKVGVAVAPCPSGAWLTKVGGGVVFAPGIRLSWFRLLGRAQVWQLLLRPSGYAILDQHHLPCASVGRRKGQRGALSRGKPRDSISVPSQCLHGSVLLGHSLTWHFKGQESLANYSRGDSAKVM